MMVKSIREYRTEIENLRFMKQESDSYQYCEFLGTDNDDLCEAIRHLKRYNREHTGPFESKAFGFTVQNGKQELVGAIHANTEWEWIFIKHLWVREEDRGMGIGRQLVERILTEANRRGIYKYYLSTFDFQAPDFYQRLGFSIFGVLPGVSGSYDSYFMKREDPRP